MFLKPKMAEAVLSICPYCKRLFSPVWIVKHKPYCFKNFFNCSLCSEKVLERDRAKHESSQCKAINSKLLVMYESPRCGELQLEKETESRAVFLRKQLRKQHERLLMLSQSLRKKETNLEEEEEEDAPEAKGVVRLVQDLKSLLLEGQYSDAVLKVDHREFRVHKAILAARSAVFASMFQHDMAEKTSGVVDIPDCTAESFEVFLHYLYTGTADTISPDNVFSLYYAADKYQVDGLKAECVEFMKSTLSVQNFCDVFDLSQRHSESELQKAATRFFLKNEKKITRTTQWHRYRLESSTAADELLVKALSALK